MYGLEEKRKQILQFVDSISDETATRKPAEDRWSVLELLEHLYLMEKLVNNQIMHTLEHGYEKDTEEKPIHLTTNRTSKVDAPERVRPQGQFTSIEQAKDALEHSREETLFLIHNKGVELLQSRAFPHPSFGEMNLEQWIEFIGWHELRHLEQMQEVVEQVSRY
ncbi:DinB family protein [Pontibacillus salicampi]